jgi:PAS domain S-box-containing protein
MEKTYSQRTQYQRHFLTRAIPLFVCFTLMGLSVWVWQLQVQSHLEQARNHTADVCLQVTRRLQILVESRLQIATIFARHWPTQSFSYQQFAESASVLIKEVPGFFALHLVHSAELADWAVPANAPSAWPTLGKQRLSLLERARRRGEIVLSDPIIGRDKNTTIFAVLTLPSSPGISPYSLVVEFRTQALLGAGFGPHLRSEFQLLITDGQSLLFQLNPTDPTFQQTLQTQQSFTLLNRRWVVTALPRTLLSGVSSNSASLLVLLLGGLLSTSLAYLVFLLTNRMELYRQEHNRALLEISEREKAQQALRISEARYRSVFDSATDGMLVLDETGLIIEANPAASSMHGYSSGTLVNRSIKELIGPDHQHLHEEFQRQLKNFGSARLDSRHRRSDGEMIDVEVRGNRVTYGGQQRLLAIITDVSERNLSARQHAILSRKVLMAQEEERARVSRELHDELGQILTAMHLELDWLAKQLGSDPPAAESSLTNATTMVEKAAEELRHICRGLRPPLLDDLGLEPAANLLIEEFQERTKIKVDLEIQLYEGKQGMAPEVALATYRILQEALHNISRHAGATEVSISLADRSGELLLSIYDNGRGFDLHEVEGTKGCGLAGMRERAFLVNGIIDIRSEPFQGTRVVLKAPLNRAQHGEDHDQDPGG